MLAFQIFSHLLQRRLAQIHQRLTVEVLRSDLRVKAVCFHRVLLDSETRFGWPLPSVAPAKSAAREPSATRVDSSVRSRVVEAAATDSSFREFDPDGRILPVPDKKAALISARERRASRLRTACGKTLGWAASSSSIHNGIRRRDPEGVMTITVPRARCAKPIRLSSTP